MNRCWVIIGLVICLVMPDAPSAQGLYFTKYVPGNYLTDNQHAVHIYNANSTPVSLGGYMLVSRDYSVIFPSSVRIPAQSSLVFAKRRSGQNQADVEFTKIKDFLIRFYDRNIEGNYIVLFNPYKKVVDGMYFSPIPNVPFLPDKGIHLNYNGDSIPFMVPQESNPVWSYIQMGSDPAIGFIKYEDEWKVTSVTSNLLPATEYKNFSVRYNDGIISLNWTTSFEEGADFHVVERSEDQEVFKEVGRVGGAGNSMEIEQYQYLDADVEQGKTYYYRIKNIDIYRHEIYSQIREIIAKDIINEFMMNVFFGKADRRGEINIRFISRFSQNVRIKMVDENFREVGILFSSYIYADIQNLLKITRPLEKGKYYLIADTERKRFFREVIIS